MGKARLQRAGALLGGSELAPIEQTDLAARSTLHAVRSVLIRELVRSQLAAVPAALRNLEPAAPYPLTIAPALQALAREVDKNSTRLYSSV